MDVSVVIRTFNEARYIGELLAGIAKQETGGLEVEIVLVDSGSTDDTLAIVAKYPARIVYIQKQDFTFGRSLNLGCGAAIGKYLVFVSGHCVPASSHWLINLVKPIAEGNAVYTYGEQLGRDTTKFSEYQVFRKYFSPDSATENPEYFVNNANSALLRTTWESYKFDETITGLEDMHLGRRLVAHHLGVSYAKEAPVYHIHDESWQQVKWRYEREALALQEIDPSLHMSRRDLLRCIVTSVFFDGRIAMQESNFWGTIIEIVAFRTNQYWGSYKGSRTSRKISDEMKRRYFYPDRK